MKISEKITADRKKRDMTQEQYAQLTGLTTGTVRNYEAGRRKPKSGTLELLITFSTEALKIAAKNAAK